jgi:hypothetical protein
LQNAPQTFTAIVAILIAAVILDAWTRARERRDAATTGAGAAQT